MNQATQLEHMADIAKRQGYLAAVLHSLVDERKAPNTAKELRAAIDDSYGLAHLLVAESALFDVRQMVDPFGEPPEAA